MKSIRTKLVFSLLPLLVSACSLQDTVKNCNHKQRNLSAVYEKIDKLVADNSQRISQKSIGDVVYDGVSYPVVLVSFKPPKARWRVFISSGLHGDEPAAVESVMDYIQTVANQHTHYSDIHIDFIPIVSPTGWRDCTRFTAANVDINREYHLFKGQEIQVLEKFLARKRYDLMIDHHEDPRNHVDAFYMVTYANDDLSALKNTLAAVKSNGFGLRDFSQTQGYFNVTPVQMPELEKRTFLLYARNHYSDNVYQVETPTVLQMQQRIKLHNLVNDILLRSLYK